MASNLTYRDKSLALAAIVGFNAGSFHATKNGVKLPSGDSLNRDDASLPTVFRPDTKSKPIRSETVALIDDAPVEFPTIEEMFKELSKSWRRHIRGKSIINYSHPAYFQILAMGWEAVPFLLKEVAQGAGTWYIALQFITKEIPETPQMRGDASAVRQAWISWGLRNGYSTELAEAQGND